jgi:hypothetical protein
VWNKSTCPGLIPLLLLVPQINKHEVPLVITKRWAVEAEVLDFLNINSTKSSDGPRPMRLICEQGGSIDFYSHLDSETNNLTPARAVARRTAQRSCQHRTMETQQGRGREGLFICSKSYLLRHPYQGSVERMKATDLVGSPKRVPELHLFFELHH